MKGVSNEGDPLIEIEPDKTISSELLLDKLIRQDEDELETTRLKNLSLWKKTKFYIKRCLGIIKIQHSRTITLDNGTTTITTNDKSVPPNIVKNQKYHPVTFIFVVLYEQFKYFFNLYYLVVAMSQFVPALKIGYLFTYITPLAFVLSITLLKEAYDDFKRWQRDREANSQIYTKLDPTGEKVNIPSSDIKIGDIILLKKDMRIPADMVLLRTTEKLGSCFIRTDQLDGETDWKLRRAVAFTQKLESDETLTKIKATIFATKPKLDIYNFVGTFTSFSDNKQDIESLSLENTMWMNTVLASGNAVGCVIYTGADTRTQLNTSSPQTKVGLIDIELNNLAKFLFVLVVLLSFLMIAFAGFKPTSAIDFFRFILLLSAIIPISLCVNLNMAKTCYSFWIMRDGKMPGTIVRTSTIPEELGRISYLLTDKTGTLTKNEMKWKKLHLGMMSFSTDSIDDIKEQLKTAFQQNRANKHSNIFTEKQLQNSTHMKIQQILTAIALCHNVTPSTSSPEDQSNKKKKKKKKNSNPNSNSFTNNPTKKDSFNLFGDNKPAEPLQTLTFADGRIVTSSRPDDETTATSSSYSVSSNSSFNFSKKTPTGSFNNLLNTPSNSFEHVSSSFNNNESSSSYVSTKHYNTPSSSFQTINNTATETQITYQASSPDEFALVQFSQSVGLTLWERTTSYIILKNSIGELVEYEILHMFPFSSETKRMGIILRNKKNRQILFLMKGADVVMGKIVKPNDWLTEECGNMAREGLRTLVYGSKVLSEEELENFTTKYQKAKTAINNRDIKMQKAVESIEKNLDLIGLTGVEDKLQDEVRSTLEQLSNAGIKIWMLTGDKIETATSIAISARLISRNQQIHVISAQSNKKEEVYTQLTNFLNQSNAALIIDGKTLEICFEHFRSLFANAACKASAVVCCRCSPTQKADIVKLIREHTKKIIAAIGDGGNDVSMIQHANVGIGIVGKEGRQASLAADYSVNCFHFIKRLIIWHGRNSYKRSAALGQFVIHRGLIISFIQLVFSAIFYFAAIAIYNGWLLVGYATIYTMAPVFSLVLDVDVTEEIAFQYPELYKELQKGRSLSYKTFLFWVLKSVFQGGCIMLLTVILFEGSMYNIVSITFTTLIFTELINVALEIRTWHYLIIISELVTVLLYFVSMVVLTSYFDIRFIATGTFVWKVVVITVVVCIPVYLSKFIRWKFFPPAYSKLKD